MFDTGTGAGSVSGDGASEWEQMLPGAEAAAVLSLVDIDSLDDTGRIAVARAWERQAAWVASQQAAVIAVLGVDTCDANGVREVVPGDDWAREELAAALRLTSQAAARRLDVARTLQFRAPATDDALSRGVISWSHATVLAEETERLCADDVGVVEVRVLPAAAAQSVPAFRRAVRRAVLAVDPVTADEAHGRARQCRYLRAWPAPDGMAELGALVPAESATRLMARVNAVAAAAVFAGEDGERPGVEQRRADALVSLVIGDAPHITTPASITVTVSAETLAGLDDEPAELGGYGPVGAATARRLAGEGRWRRALTEPVTAHLLDLSPHSYRPSAALARFVTTRDRRCTFPHCEVPAARCDLDHAVAFAAGGPTTRANLGALCRRHHRAKHEGGWGMSRDDTGRASWTSPAGYRYSTGPPG